MTIMTYVRTFLWLKIKPGFYICFAFSGSQNHSFPYNFKKKKKKKILKTKFKNLQSLMYLLCTVVIYRKENVVG